MNHDTLLMADFLVGVLIVLLLIAVLSSQWWIRFKFVEAVEEARADRAIQRDEQNQQHEEIVELLRLTRDMATSARDNRKETAEAVKGVQQELHKHPTREEISQKIEEVPSRTAAAVVEKLPDSRPDWRGHEKQKE